MIDIAKGIALAVSMALSPVVVAEAGTGAAPIVCSQQVKVVGAALSPFARGNDKLTVTVPAWPKVAGTVNGEPRSIPLAATSGIWSQGWDGKAPAPALVKRFYALALIKSAPCAETFGRVVAHLGHILQANGYVEKNRISTDPTSFSFIGPAISPTGREGLVYVSYGEYPLGGQDVLLHLKKRGGYWKIIGTRVIAVG